MIDLVIFDCDGVLVDSERLGIKIDVMVLASFGWTLTEQEVASRFLGVSAEDFRRAIEGHIGRRLPDGWEAEFDPLYRQAYERELRPVDGIEEALDRIHLPTCVASSGTHDKMRFTLGLTGLYERFRGRLFSATDVVHGKPAPDLFLHAAERMGFAPRACVVVEDSANGVRAARAAGMTALGFAGGLTDAATLKALGARVFADMRRLPDILEELNGMYRPGGNIVLVPHDPRWSGEFDQERQRIERVAGRGRITLYHIGSTAVPGILAKPVIDMLAVVDDLGTLESMTPALENIGYEAKGEFGIAGRRYFRKTSLEGVRTHQIHGFQIGSSEIIRHLAFRDYLIAHPDVAAEYSVLKQELARRFGSEVEGYADAKTDFIRDVERKAMTRTPEPAMSEDQGVVFRPLDRSDSARFGDESDYETYLADQEAGLRSVHVAVCEGQIAGYVTVLWTAEDPSFREQGIPEISDLQVHVGFRRRGIGTALMERAEAEAASRSRRVGLNVGLHSGYGTAQRLYVRRGYLPDGSGVILEGEVVPEGATIRLDDNPIATLRMTKDLRLRD